MAGSPRRVATIPYGPRPQFKDFHERNERWACLIAHRRAGKTVACINDLIRKAIECRLPDARFGYIAPTFTQAKDVAWQYLKRYAGPILGSEPNESELRVDLCNGSRIRLYGADNADRMRGLYFDGLVLDEYALMRPSVWGEVIRPTLSDRGGWAVFIGTPKGRTGLYDIWSGRNQWRDVPFFRRMLRASETGILSEEELRDARATMTEEQYDQEYECSFEAALLGSIFGKAMTQAEKQGRICGVPYDPGALVYTAWDLGIGKGGATCIWFAQRVGREVHLIDYYEGSGVDIGHYAAHLKSTGYNFGGHILPHDADKNELTSGRSVKQTLEDLNVAPITVLQRAAHIEDGINAARLLIPTCWFDDKRCERGIEALRQYRYEYDEKLASFKLNPLHDWASHPADAFRYLAEGLSSGVGQSKFNKPLKLPELGIV